MLTSLLRRCRPALLLALALPAAAQPSGPTIGGERGRPTDEGVGRGWLERRWAESDLERLAAAVAEHERARGVLPAGAGLDAVDPGLLGPRAPIDPWGQPYRLAWAEGRSLRSSGPDGVADTGDDLVLALDERAAGVRTNAPPPGESPPAATRLTRLTSEAASTHRRMLALSAALESFRRQRGHYPVGVDGDGLQLALVPEHLDAREFTPVDGWGRPWRYRSNDVGSSYTLVSAGADGAHESLVPLRPGPVEAPERDLVVVDGRFARWPAGLDAPDRMPARTAASTPAPAPRPVRRAAPEPRPVRSAVEPGKTEATRTRLEAIAEALQRFRAKEGRYPELDDASRLMSVIGVGQAAKDAWGRELGYLSLAAGSRCVIASRGADGRLDRSLEDYLRGASLRGDDLVWVNAKPVR